LNRYKSEFALSATDSSVPKKDGIEQPVKTQFQMNIFITPVLEMELAISYLSGTIYVFSPDLQKCFSKTPEIPPDNIRSVIS
jgi:hypothetical protein